MGGPVDSETLRELLQSPPQNPTSHAVILDWLGELGLPHGDEVRNAGVPVSVVVYHDHDQWLEPGFYAVPDAAFDPVIREALAQMHGRVHATEDIAGDEWAGGLWLLALIKKMWLQDLEHFADHVPSIDREALLSARRESIWDGYAIADDGPVREAQLTHCYAVELAH